MAVEHCVQLSTSATVRAVAAKSHVYLTPNREKCNLATFQGLKRPLSLSTSTISLPSRSHKSSFVCHASNAVNQVENVTEKDWESLVLGSKIPVMVDFWAPWCGPCKLIAPEVEALAKDYAGKIAVYKLNTDVSPTIATKYNIRSIPTVVFFKDGERKESVVGAVPRSTLTDTIEKYLAL